MWKGVTVKLELLQGIEKSRGTRKIKEKREENTNRSRDNETHQASMDVVTKSTTTSHWGLV